MIAKCNKHTYLYCFKTCFPNDKIVKEKDCPYKLEAEKVERAKPKKKRRDK